MLEMKAYKPKVRCINPRGQASPPEDCNEVYDNMLLSEIVTDIRHTRQSASDIEVPYVVQPGRPIKSVSSFQCCELSLIQYHFVVQPDCEYRIDLAGADDRETRYNIWEAMVALDQMCTDLGKMGIAYGLGSLENKGFRDLRRMLMIIGHGDRVIVELLSGANPLISSA